MMSRPRLPPRLARQLRSPCARSRRSSPSSACRHCVAMASPIAGEYLHTPRCMNGTAHHDGAPSGIIAAPGLARELLGRSASLGLSQSSVR
jgi:hypothetical protein